MIIYCIISFINSFEYLTRFSEIEYTQKLLYFRYHVELVKLLACCTMGKNVNTEIKCHSLLPLDDIVAVVSHPDCIPEVNLLSNFKYLYFIKIDKEYYIDIYNF